MEISMTLELVGNSLFGEIRYCGVGGEQYLLLSPKFSIIRVHNEENGIGQNIDFKYKGIKKLFNKKLNVYEIPQNIENMIVSFGIDKPFKMARNITEFNSKIINLDNFYCRYFPYLFQGNINSLDMPLFEDEGRKYESITLKGFQNYEIINAEDDKLLFPCKFTPYKLLAYNKNYINKVELENVTVYMRKKKELKYAKVVAQETNNIINWYNENLYLNKPINSHQYIISLSTYIRLNGFWRANTITYDNISSNRKMLINYFIPHEIAHNWGICDQSVVDYKEHFLDEGVAEWSAIYYRYHNNLKFHKKFLAMDIKKFYKTEKLQSKKNLRYTPHSKGFDFFYSIFIKYGIERVKDCLLHFVNTEKQSAAGFIKEIAKHENQEFCLMIDSLMKKALTYC